MRESNIAALVLILAGCANPPAEEPRPDPAEYGFKSEEEMEREDREEDRRDEWNHNHNRCPTYEPLKDSKSSQDIYRNK